MIKRLYIDIVTIACLLLFVQCANQSKLSDDVEALKQQLEEANQAAQSGKEGLQDGLGKIALRFEQAEQRNVEEVRKNKDELGEIALRFEQAEQRNVEEVRKNKDELQKFEAKMTSFIALTSNHLDMFKLVREKEKQEIEKIIAQKRAEKPAVEGQYTTTDQLKEAAQVEIERYEKMDGHVSNMEDIQSTLESLAEHIVPDEVYTDRTTDITDSSTSNSPPTPVSRLGEDE